nr:hypothetical protein [Marivita sp. XM-24bin2]
MAEDATICCEGCSICRGGECAVRHAPPRRSGLFSNEFEGLATEEIGYCRPFWFDRANYRLRPSRIAQPWRCGQQQDVSESGRVSTLTAHVGKKRCVIEIHGMDLVHDEHVIIFRRGTCRLPADHVRFYQVDISFAIGMLLLFICVCQDVGRYVAARRKLDLPLVADAFGRNDCDPQGRIAPAQDIEDHQSLHRFAHADLIGEQVTDFRVGKDATQVCDLMWVGVSCDAEGPTHFPGFGCDEAFEGVKARLGKVKRIHERSTFIVAR